MRKRFVSFRLAGGHYCVPVEQVQQIQRLEGLIEIPKPPPYVEGVLNIRGDIVPVVNLRTRMNLPGLPEQERGPSVARVSPDPRKRRVVICRVAGKPYGLDVDEVREIVEIEESGISDEATTMLGVRAEFLAGIAKTEDGMHMILDLPRILGSRDVPGARPGQA